jgi:general secretion pathway protein G
MLARLYEARDEANENGFTLIELLIVIVILGILAAIVVFSVSGITSKGTTSACQTDVKIIDTAAEAFYAQTGAGAANIGALVDANLIHADKNFKSGVTGDVTITGSPNYVIKWTAGTATTAGGADTTTCPTTG